jgi:hypothetical protein
MTIPPTFSQVYHLSVVERDVVVAYHLGRQSWDHIYIYRRSIESNNTSQEPQNNLVLELDWHRYN